jgi:hypothetical protein
MADIASRLFGIIDSRAWERLPEVFHAEVVYERPGYDAFTGLDRLLRALRVLRVRNAVPLRLSVPLCVLCVRSCSTHGEFDPGSGRTLAARLTHASRTEGFGLQWRTGA